MSMTKPLIVVVGASRHYELFGKYAGPSDGIVLVDPEPSPKPIGPTVELDALDLFLLNQLNRPQKPKRTRHKPPAPWFRQFDKKRKK